jgi:regulator of sirC expression with transglutaminase-like and TPR domain
MTLAAQFADIFQARDATPELLAMELARIADPSLDAGEQLAQLDVLAEYVQGELASNPPPGESSAELFLRIVTQQLDFHGDQEHYHDPANSLLPAVLQRRMGLPIMLCLVCIAVGRRVGQEIVGLGFPSHFLALHRGREGDTVLDPFLGVTLAPNEVERHLARMIGRPVQLTPDAWRAQTAQEMALRILHNLRNAYLHNKDLAMVVRVLDYLVAVRGDEAQYRRERGLIHLREKRWVDAHYDLRHYLLRVGLLPGSSQSVEAGAASPTTLANQGDKRILEAYKEASVMLSRIN